MPFDIDTYFQKEVDDRDIHGAYNFELISDLLPDFINASPIWR